MKILYFNYIEFVIGEAVDAAFAKDLYKGYRSRFTDMKLSPEIFIQNMSINFPSNIL